MKAKEFLSNGTSNDSRSALRSEVNRAGDSPQPLREGARLQKRTGGTGFAEGLRAVAERVDAAAP